MLEHHYEGGREGNGKEGEEHYQTRNSEKAKKKKYINNLSKDERRKRYYLEVREL